MKTAFLIGLLTFQNATAFATGLKAPQIHCDGRVIIVEGGQSEHTENSYSGASIDILSEDSGDYSAIVRSPREKPVLFTGLARSYFNLGGEVRMVKYSVEDAANRNVANLYTPASYIGKPAFDATLWALMPMDGHVEFALTCKGAL